MSTAALNRALPRKSRRAISSAAPTPKIVLRGTATATISRVSQKACTASGVVAAFQAASTPCSKVRYPTMPSGSTRSTVKYPSARPRSANLPGAAVSLPLMARPPLPDEADDQQHDERQEQQRDRDRGRAGEVVALDLLGDEDRADLGL